MTKFWKRIGISLSVVATLVAIGYALLRYIALSDYPLKGGGVSYAPDKSCIARSLAIIERPYFGKEHRYYRFELVEGNENGRVLRSVTMELPSGEPFLMVRGDTAFPVKWNADSVTFFAQGVELILHKTTRAD